MMRFLRWLFLTLTESLSKRGSMLDPIVGTNENLSRFILSSRHFSQQPPRIKAEAYMPSQGEVSVFRVDGLSKAQIWKIGSEIAERRGRTHYACGEAAARDVRRIGLDVVRAEPPPRHANIVGWPESQNALA